MNHRILLLHSKDGALSLLKSELVAAGYEVRDCEGGFDALECLRTDRAAMLVCPTTLSDMDSYMLASLLNSSYSTMRLPVILVGRPKDEHSKFRALALRNYMCTEVSEPGQAFDVIRSMLPELADYVRIANQLKHYREDTNIHHAYSSSDILESSAALLHELLVEKIVADSVRLLLVQVEPRRRFIEHFFRMVGQLLDCSIFGIVLYDVGSPWGVLNFSGNYNKTDFDLWLEVLARQAYPEQNLDMEILGELTGNDSLLPPEVLVVGNGQDVFGALIFAPARADGFDDTSHMIMAQLQLQMLPVMQLLHVRQQLERLYDKYRFQVVTDELTGVYNLDFLIGFIQQQLLFSFRQRTQLSLLLIKIEGLTQINKEVGLEVGNLVLVQVANLLLNHVRGSDLLARCSGNTFAIVLPNTDKKGARALGEKFYDQICALEFAQGNISSVCARIGCAQAASSEMNPAELLRQAQIDLRVASEKPATQL